MAQTLNAEQNFEELKLFLTPIMAGSEAQATS